MQRQGQHSLETRWYSAMSPFIQAKFVLDEVLFAEVPAAADRPIHQVQHSRDLLPVALPVRSSSECQHVSDGTAVFWRL